MAGQYRTQFRNIQIVSVDEVKPKDVRRNNIKQFHVSTFSSDHFNCFKGLQDQVPTSSQSSQDTKETQKHLCCTQTYRCSLNDSDTEQMKSCPILLSEFVYLRTRIKAGSDAQ